MRIETVIECVNKLSTNYDLVPSDKQKDERIKLFAEAFKHKLDNSLRAAVDSIIHDENVKKFPMVTQVENYMPAITERHQKFCDKCEGTGYFNVWQYRESIGRYCSFAYRCACNTTSMNEMPILHHDMIPKRAHNPYPPGDNRHDEFNARVINS